MSLPESPEKMLKLLSSLSDEELQEMMEAQQQLERRLIEQGPQNDTELHEWLKYELRIDIPRVAVCEGHQAPFSFLADLYFERIEAALGVANRGGAKTFMVAVLHWLNSRFKPGCESCTFGAIEAQSFRAYAHLKNWIYDDNGNRKAEVISSLMRETIFSNTSKIEVLGSTPEAVNGPHPQKAHADEIELMRDDTWQESRNMTISKQTRDGRLIRPQDIATSTRKGPSGRVQELIDEIAQAVAEGFKPPRKLYVWCIKETAGQVPNCQCARPNLPEALRCPCDRIRKGEWDDGTPRLLRDVCKGDFYRSRGWQPFGDVVKQFTENDRDTFEVQQLCAKPEMRMHYVPQWNDAKHCIRQFQPDPANGPIFTATDWGGTNPHSVHWYQLLRNEVEVLTWEQNEAKPTKKRIREGALVCFDEIYIAEIGNDKLGEMVKQTERRWQRQFGPAWQVYERYADPQGKAARMDWRAMGLRTVWHTTREFEEHVKAIKDLFEDDLFFVDGERCQKFVWEIKQWQRDQRNPERQLDVNNHSMSEFRYAVANIKKIRRRAMGAGVAPQAKTIERRAEGLSRIVSRPRPAQVGLGSQSEYAKWRKSLGAPATRPRPGADS